MIIIIIIINVKHRYEIYKLFHCTYLEIKITLNAHENETLQNLRIPQQLISKIPIISFILGKQKFTNIETN
jgi:hypothetical protein